MKRQASLSEYDHHRERKENSPAVQTNFQMKAMIKRVQRLETKFFRRCRNRTTCSRSGCIEKRNKAVC